MTDLQAYAQTSQFSVSTLTAPNDSYSYAIKPFAAYIVARGETEVTIEAIRDYFTELNTSDYSPSTVRVRRQAVKDRVRRTFAHATEDMRRHVETELQELDRDPATKCPGAKAPAVSTERVLTDREYMAVLAACRSRKQALFIETLATTGARVSELTGIRPGDATVNGNVVTLQLRGKGNKRMSYKPREVYISKRLYEAIRDEFRGETYLFETGGGKAYRRTYISNQIARITRKAIGRELRAHSLRHTFATNTIKKTGRLSAVSRYLGHSSVRVTEQFYDHDQLDAADILGAEAIAS